MFFADIYSNFLCLSEVSTAQTIPPNTQPEEVGDVFADIARVDTQPKLPTAQINSKNEGITPQKRTFETQTTEKVIIDNDVNRKKVDVLSYIYSCFLCME
eukprot:UN06183